MHSSAYGSRESWVPRCVCGICGPELTMSDEHLDVDSIACSLARRQSRCRISDLGASESAPTPVLEVSLARRVRASFNGSEAEWGRGQAWGAV